jgi:carbon monoxide dehydrogenase subunit G
MATQFHLSEGDSGGTHMRWEADVRIAGQVGSMGQRVLQPILNEQVRNVLAALDQRVAAASAGS